MKKTIITIAFFTLILIAMFLWNDTGSLSIQKQIDDDKIANFFTAFSGIVVSISLYFLYKQLREMKSGYLPDLYFSYAEFRVKVEPGRDYIDDKSVLKVKQLKEIDGLDINGYFQLHNIGLGSCKHISINWIYNLDDVKKIIKDKFQHWPIFTTESQHIDFLEKDGKIQIEIPEFYFLCCAEEDNFNINNHREIADKVLKGLPIKPKLEVTVKYHDIQNELYTKKFNVEIIPINDILRIKFMQF